MKEPSEAVLQDLLERGVDEVFVREHLEAVLRSGKRLTVKFGIDPTSPSIHLGRAVPLWKLRAFQDLGHDIALIIGDFTAKIGDPSDKLEKRPMLTDADIKKNLKGYLAALGKIVDVKKAKVYYNSKWLSKLTFAELAELAESFSVLQMTNRRNFKERLARGEEVSLREFLYPLMQGYDSVAVKANVEIGGADQLFNLKAGRIVQRHYGKEEQDVLTTAMLEGTDGRKMSSSWGNVISITDEPNDMFGKVMSLKDELMGTYYRLATDLTLEEIRETEASLAQGTITPMFMKRELAKAIVRRYHGDKKAEEAEREFVRVFEKREIPEDVIKVKEAPTIREALVPKIIPSNSEFARLAVSGAIRLIKEGGEIKIINANAPAPEGSVFRVGKHRFVRIIK